MKRSKPLQRGKPLRRGRPLARGQPLQRGTKPLKRAGRLKARKVPRAFRQRRDHQYCDWIRCFPCLICGHHEFLHGGMLPYGRVEVAHVRSRGAGGDDHSNVVPLCSFHHAQQHSMGIRSFQKTYGRDLPAEAARLDQEYQRETGAP